MEEFICTLRISIRINDFDDEIIHNIYSLVHQNTKAAFMCLAGYICKYKVVLRCLQL